MKELEDLLDAVVQLKEAVLRILREDGDSDASRRRELLVPYYLWCFHFTFRHHLDGSGFDLSKLSKDYQVHLHEQLEACCTEYNQAFLFATNILHQLTEELPTRLRQLPILADLQLIRDELSTILEIIADHARNSGTDSLFIAQPYAAIYHCLA